MFLLYCNTAIPIIGRVINQIPIYAIPPINDTITLRNEYNMTRQNHQNQNTHSPNTIDSADQWYVDSFADHYKTIYNHRDDTSAQNEIISLIKYLNLNPPARLLDICCGNGRHAATLHELGFDTFAFDLSPQLLHDAAQRPELKNRVIRADIRAIPFTQSFDAALNLFTSFGYFTSDIENALALKQIANTIKPTGLLILDHINRAWLTVNLKPQSIENRDDIHIRHKRHIENNRIIKDTTVTFPNSNKTKTFTENVRLYHPNEMTSLFKQLNFTNIRQLGSFTGEELTPSSQRMITIGTKT